MNVSSPSLERELLKTLRQAEEPLTADQILERLPAACLAGEQDPRRKLKTLLTRSEVGHAARGRYVYLPSRITGSMLRVPITGREAESGELWLGPELVYALWFNQIDWGNIPPGSSAVCELPDGTSSRLTVEQMARNRRHVSAWLPIVAAGPELRDWLHAEKATAGDSLVVRIADAEHAVCQAELERLSERDDDRIASRNQELAEHVIHVLRDGVRGKPLSEYDLAGWLLARELYRDVCPPDPLTVALLSDARLTQDDHGHFALATMWEWVRERNLELPEELLEALEATLPTRQQVLESVPGLTEAKRRALLGVDPIEELKPWLEAAGYETGAAEEETSAAEAGAPAGSEIVYRIRAAFKHRPSVQRVLEARGDNTLAELDSTLRHVFRHDTSDHMSGFFVRTGAGRKREELASFNPFGEMEEGEDFELAELELEPGDELSYIYDFGDWIEHTIQVEAVLAPEPGAIYPRQVGRGTASGGKRTRARKGS
jgi:hypothetical protein